MIWTPRLIEARDFFRAAHDSIGQVRKYSGEPYWVHTEEVAETAQEAGASENEVIAGFGHDTLEDVFPKNPKYDLALIVATFGEEVGGLIVELTDVYTREAYPKHNRHARHEMERARQATISEKAKRLKLLDLKSNTKSIVAQDPNFAVVYLKEKAALLPLLRTPLTEPVWLTVEAQLKWAKKELDKRKFPAIVGA